MGAVFRKKICSPAKINLHLAVGEKRADGFHDIESIFVPVSLYDYIDLSVFRSPVFSVTMPRKGFQEPGPLREDGGPLAGGEGVHLNERDLREGPAAPAPAPPPGLMYRAALLFHQQTGLTFSLRIAIEKNIPLGAGLGGGSSNAAAVLCALNAAAGFPLSHDALMETAARLGSDVPFFVEGKPAFVTGRGEKVVPFDLARDLFFVLVKPAFASETPEAYRLLDERRSVSRDPAQRDPVAPETLIAALEKPPSAWPYRNDFQSVFLDDAHPHSGAYREVFAALQETGAPFTLLSGSGSTVFGVYESEGAAQAAAQAVAQTVAKRLGTRHEKTRHKPGQPETRPPLVRHCAAIWCN